MRLWSRALLLGFAAAGLVAAPARADEGEVVALRGEVAQIRAHLEAVEARLRALEHPGQAALGQAAAVPVPAPVTPAPAAAPAPAAVPMAMQVTGGESAAPDPAAARRIAWRKLREGLSEAEVDTLLGPPTKRFELSGKLVRYYYYQGVGAGSVFFDAAGRISSVQHPPGAG